jgi:uncharacterized protein
MFESSIAPVRDRLIAAGVSRLGVFGSFAKGSADETSDVDVLVTFYPNARTFDNLYSVGEALEEAFHRKIDLITEDSLSPYLAPKIRGEVRYVDLGR